MLIIKIMGISLILLSGGLITLKVSLDYSERIDELTELLKMMDSVKNDISFLNRPLIECLKSFKSNNREIARFRGILIDELTCGRSPKIAVKKAFSGTRLKLKQEDFAVTENFFSDFGKLPLEGQLNHAMHAIAALGKNLAEAKTDAERNRKTNCSVIMAGALALIIILT